MEPLLLPALKASLTGFHRYQKDFYNGFVSSKPDEKVGQYLHYLRMLRGDDWYEHQFRGPFSHWGTNSHAVHIYWDFSDRSTSGPKQKKPKNELRVWLENNHPEILKEFSQKAA